MGSLDTLRNIPDVFVQGSYAFVAAWENGLRVVDISNPSSPSEVGFLEALSLARGVFVQGTVAIVFDGGLRIVDVSNPASPRPVGFIVGYLALGLCNPSLS